MRSNLSIAEKSLRCEAKYNTLKDEFKKARRTNKQVLKIKKLLSDLNKNRDEISSLLLAF